VVSEKPWGPNLLKFAVGFSSDTQGENTFGLHARHKRVWLNSLGAEWNNELEVGTTASYATELYAPLNLAQSLFATAYGTIASAPQNLFDRGRKIAEYEVLRERAGADLGYVLGDWGELRIGPQFTHQRAQPRVAPTEVSTTMDEWGLSAAARVDTQDHAFFPRRGLRLAALVFTGTRRVGGADHDVTRAELDVHQVIPVGERDTLDLGARLGASNRFDPTFAANFHLGGFLEVSGLRSGEAQGTYLGRGRAVYLHRVGNLPGLGNAYYAGGSLEIGNVWSRRDAISFGDTYKAGSVFVVTDTPFGPFYVAWGHTFRGESTWYLLLGRP
jgi:NTE family protein